MRERLAWTLAATVVLSLVAWSIDERPLPLVGAVAPVAQPWEPAMQESFRRGGSIRRASSALPAELPPFGISPATRDIFAERAPAQAAPVTVANRGVSAPAVVEQPTPLAPPLQVRYAGSMQSPDGRRIVYLARGESSFEVHKGDRLDEGYIVDAIGEAGIALVYPPLGTKATVAVPTVSAQ